jgi:hypothetical protein
MLARISGYVRAHHIGLVALFVALGGTSYAAIKLPANSVGTKQLKKDAVTLKKIKKSTRQALKGQSGPRGAPGAAGPRGGTGLQGPAGPGAIRLDWSGTTNPPTTTPLFSRQGLTITAVCDRDQTLNGRISLNFGATGAGAAANATWTDERSISPTTTNTFQDGVANGTLTVGNVETVGFRRLEGQAVLRMDGLTVSVVFHALVTPNSCKVDGTAVPAT